MTASTDQLILDLQAYRLAADRFPGEYTPGDEEQHMAIVRELTRRGVNVSAIPSPHPAT
jgi:hypothetical protein